jgi:hypothetical protein
MATAPVSVATDVSNGIPVTVRHGVLYSVLSMF